jgi:hypothetical protein
MPRPRTLEYEICAETLASRRSNRLRRLRRPAEPGGISCTRLAAEIEVLRPEAVYIKWYSRNLAEVGESCQVDAFAVHRERRRASAADGSQLARSRINTKCRDSAGRSVADDVKKSAGWFGDEPLSCSPEPRRPFTVPPTA